MLKIVVFDGGFGGDLFADAVEKRIDTIEVIRVIDWRHADKLLSHKRVARKYAESALKPYIGKVDLIIFANQFIAITSLKYFRRRYKNQKFLGIKLKIPESFINCETLILTTEAVAKTITYRDYVMHLKRRTKTLLLDSWPSKIDDGELTEREIDQTFRDNVLKKGFRPKEVILNCTQFNDIIPEIKNVFGHNTKIYDAFTDTIVEACKILKLRGGAYRRK